MRDVLHDDWTAVGRVTNPPAEPVRQPFKIATRSFPLGLSL